MQTAQEDAAAPARTEQAELPPQRTRASEKPATPNRNSTDLGDAPRTARNISPISNAAANPASIQPARNTFPEAARISPSCNFTSRHPPLPPQRRRRHGCEHARQRGNGCRKCLLHDQASSSLRKSDGPVNFMAYKGGGAAPDGRPRWPSPAPARRASLASHSSLRSAPHPSAGNRSYRSRGRRERSS